jgi:hypothetical protein
MPPLTAPILNSVTPGDGQATLNVTPADEGGYDHTQVRYKKRGAAAWTYGVTDVGTPGGAGDVVQTGLDNFTLYDFEVIAYDGGGFPSLTSDTDSQYITDGSEESETLGYIANLKTLLANCAALHTWLELTGTWEEKVTAAKARIYDMFAPEAGVVKPCVMIDDADDFDLDPLSGGGGTSYLSKETLMFRFIADAASQVDPKSSLTAFMQAVGPIVEQMQALAGTDNFLNVRRFKRKKRADLWQVKHQAKEIQEHWEAECGLAA